MRKIKIYLCILIVLCVLPGVALVETNDSIEDILCGGPWQAPNGTGTVICFSPDGTGSVTVATGDTYNSTWEYDGFVVNLTYTFFGERMASYFLTQDGGVNTLLSADGMNSFVQTKSGGIMPAADITVPEPAHVKTIHFGDEIDMGFAKMSFQSPNVLRAIYTKDNFGFIPLSDNQYFCLIGKLSNTGGREFSVDNLNGEITFDGQYTYSLSARVDYNGSLLNKLSPLCDATYYIFASIPNKLVDSFTSAVVRFSVNRDFSNIPASANSGDFAYEIIIDETAAAQSKQKPVKELVYYDESPSLLKPESFADVRESGHNSSSINGETTLISYNYRVLYDDDDINDILNQYVVGLTACGYTVNTKTRAESEILYNKTRLATVRIESDTMKISIVPGNDSVYTETVQKTEPAYPQIALGEKIRLKNAEITIDDTAKDKMIYSSVAPRDNGHYTYYQSSNGTYLYLRGSIKNTGRNPIDIRHVYCTFTFDDQYVYPGEWDGAAKDSNVFIHDVAPMTAVTYFCFADIPDNVLNTYKECVVRVGFTDNFNIKVTDAVSQLDNFRYCNDIYEIRINNSGEIIGDIQTLSPKTNTSAGKPSTYTQEQLRAIEEAGFPLPSADAPYTDEELSILKAAGIDLTTSQETDEATASGYVFAFENAVYTVSAKGTLKIMPVLQGAQIEGNAVYSWATSDKSVAKAAGGVITGVSAGSATITCTMKDKSKNQYTAMCEVRVIQPVLGIKCEAENVNVPVAGTYQLTPKISPNNATNPGLRFSSSDEMIATVDANGLVIGVNAGTCSILIESADGSGKTAKQKVSVVPFVIDVKEIVLTERETYVFNLPGCDVFSGMMLRYDKGCFEVGNIYTYQGLGGYGVDVAFDMAPNFITLHPVKAGNGTLTIMNDNAYFNTGKPRVKYVIKVKVEHSAVYDATSFPPLSYAKVVGDPEAYSGQPVSFNGVIVRVDAMAEGVNRYTVAVNGKNSNLIIVNTPKCESGITYNVGEKLSVYGEIGEPLRYTTDTNIEMSTPLVIAEKINDVLYNSKMTKPVIEHWD